jgi:hypothetical protein
MCEAGQVSTVAGQAMKELVAAVQPTLKERQFRKRGNAFNRTAKPDGLVHVINFQMGAFDPPGTVETPGLRPNLYGRFTINLGVWLPGVMEPGDLAPRARPFVNEYNCHLRERIGFLLPQHQDTWWPLSTPTDELAATITSVIDQYVYPWLAKFATWDGALHELEEAPAGRKFMTSPRLLAMDMRRARSEARTGHTP